VVINARIHLTLKNDSWRYSVHVEEYDYRIEV
jgi:hypothetical protein